MQDLTLSPEIQTLADEIKELADAIKAGLNNGKTLYINLSVPSMLRKTSQEIQSEVKRFNEMVEYLIDHGQQCQFSTAQLNNPDPLTFNEFLQFSSEKSIFRIVKCILYIGSHIFVNK